MEFRIESKSVTPSLNTVSLPIISRPFTLSTNHPRTEIHLSRVIVHERTPKWDVSNFQLVSKHCHTPFPPNQPIQRNSGRE